MSVAFRRESDEEHLEPKFELPLPAGAELGLAILRLLPTTPEEMARFQVDERFVRLAARYRALFRGFLDRVPETGPLNRAHFGCLSVPAPVIGAWPPRSWSPIRTNDPRSPARLDGP